MKIPARAKILVFAVAFVMAGFAPTRRAQARGDFDLASTDITIFVPDTDQVIGHGHYEVVIGKEFDTVKGENKYLDGEYDHEEQTVQPSTGGVPPVLVSYRHQYFNPDGSLQYEDSLDARTGAAACHHYEGSVPDVHDSVLKVPSDTYAGATQLMLLVGRLRQGASEITFNSYNCLPEPRIVPVTAVPAKYPVAWERYPGQLVKLEMKPDFGWLNTFIAPFVPKVYGWFDPASSFNYVGGQFDRFFKGRHVLMVRNHDDNRVVEGSQASSGAH